MFGLFVLIAVLELRLGTGRGEKTEMVMFYSLVIMSTTHDVNKMPSDRLLLRPNNSIIDRLLPLDRCFVEVAVQCFIGNVRKKLRFPSCGFHGMLPITSGAGAV